MSPDPLALMDRALEGGFPCALWSLPGRSGFQGVADLGILRKRGREDSSPGFVYNRFDSHHPPVPGKICADLRIAGGSSGLEFESVLPVEGLEAALMRPGGLNVAQPIRELPAFDFRGIVEKARGCIASGALQKVVLARAREVPRRGGLSLRELFEKAVRAYPDAFTFLVQTHDEGTWLGASPELFLSVEDNVVNICSLAGSQVIGKGTPTGQVSWKEKEIQEQALVSRYIIEYFKKIRLRAFTETGPRTVRAAGLAHLRTDYRIDLAEAGMEDLPGTLISLLHPTPAVCGAPLEASMAFLGEFEPLGRDLFGGFLGPRDPEGSTQLFVNIRCMRILRDRFRLYAGAGVVRDSDPVTEEQETGWKFRTMEDIL